MAYKKQLRDKDGNVVYPDVGLDLDDVVYSDDPTEVVEDIIDPSSYSLDEKWTGGYWVDGKKIYKKTIYLGALPNNTTKTVSLGVDNVSYAIKIEGSAYRASDGAFFTIPNASALAVANSIDVAYLNNTKEVQIRTGMDRTGCIAYVTVYYTKTS